MALETRTLKTTGAETASAGWWIRQWRGPARSWLPLQRADVFVKFHEQVGVFFLLARFQIRGLDSGDRLHRRMPMSLGLAPRPPKKTKRKNKEQKHGPPEEGRGEGEGQTQTSNLFGEERRKNTPPPKPASRTVWSLTPSQREKTILQQFEGLMQQNRICHLSFPFDIRW